MATTDPARASAPPQPVHTRRLWTSRRAATALARMQHRSACAATAAVATAAATAAGAAAAAAAPPCLGRSAAGQRPRAEQGRVVPGIRRRPTRLPAAFSRLCTRMCTRSCRGGAAMGALRPQEQVLRSNRAHRIQVLKRPPLGRHLIRGVPSCLCGDLTRLHHKLSLLRLRPAAALSWRLACPSAVPRGGPVTQRPRRRAQLPAALLQQPSARFQAPAVRARTLVWLPGRHSLWRRQQQQQRRRCRARACWRR